MEYVQVLADNTTNVTLSTVLTEQACQIMLFPIAFIGILFGALQFWIVSRTPLYGGGAGDQLLPNDEEEGGSINDDGKNDTEIKDNYTGAPEDPDEKVKYVLKIQGYIQAGAQSFLFQEYLYCVVFMVAMAILLVCTVESEGPLKFKSAWTTVAFLAGATTSMLAGYIGMTVAVYANARVALAAQRSLQEGFKVAFRSGSVMGFCLTGLGLLVLACILVGYNYAHQHDTVPSFRNLYESIAGFGLGGSSIALFGRVGGGIYTKAADVGADLVGKVEKDLPEDSPKNPGTIADNVGDNVGDVAGMGADLFGSFAESTSATLVVCASIADFEQNRAAMYFPILISAFGIIVCLITSLLATELMEVKQVEQIEKTLKIQLIVSTILMTPAMYLACYLTLPETWMQANSEGVMEEKKQIYAFICGCLGVWGGLAIGYITEYYTSYAYTPTQDVAKSCQTGAATNIIYGLALGYLSTIIPVSVLAIIAYVAAKLLGMLGIGIGALGMLSTLAIGLTIDSYGPISDNAGGIAEMAELTPQTREYTDALDAAGNTTAAIGKGFAIGSAALVGLALYGAFITRSRNNKKNLLCEVVVTDPLIFSGMLIGAMLPYAFSAMTMKSVGEAALDMVKEIRRQIEETPEILEGTVEPDYDRCIAISTRASLREMIPPGILVMCTPLAFGLAFGPKAVGGLLPGIVVSGIQMAFSASNTGGAWDNAKKFIEADKLYVDGVAKGKGTEEHKAAVIGDTVGDPLKDTSGPSLNILIKLSAIISLVFSALYDNTGYLVSVLNEQQGVFNATGDGQWHCEFNK